MIILVFNFAAASINSIKEGVNLFLNTPVKNFSETNNSFVFSINEKTKYTINYTNNFENIQIKLNRKIVDKQSIDFIFSILVLINYLIEKIDDSTKLLDEFKASFYIYKTNSVFRSLQDFIKFIYDNNLKKLSSSQKANLFDEIVNLSTLPIFNDLILKFFEEEDLSSEDYLAKLDKLIVNFANYHLSKELFKTILKEKRKLEIQNFFDKYKSIKFINIFELIPFNLNITKVNEEYVTRIIESKSTTRAEIETLIDNIVYSEFSNLTLLTKLFLTYKNFKSHNLRKLKSLINFIYSLDTSKTKSLALYYNIMFANSVYQIIDTLAEIKPAIITTNIKSILQSREKNFYAFFNPNKEFTVCSAITEYFVTGNEKSKKYIINIFMDNANKKLNSLEFISGLYFLSKIGRDDLVIPYLRTIDKEDFSRIQNYRETYAILIKKHHMGHQINYRSFRINND